MNEKRRCAFAVCGSFCTLETALEQAQELTARGWELLPVMSNTAARCDTRFGRAGSWRQRLEALTELRGKAVVGEWIEKVRAGRTREVVLELLKLHYDPTYAASIARNFELFPQAWVCQLDRGSAEAMASAASGLVARSD